MSLPRLLALGVAHGLMASQALAAPAAPLQLAWLDAGGQLHAELRDAQGRPLGGFDADQPVALGSLWKLVAYAQWVESGVPPTPLRCTGASREEVYCCGKGESIDRATALVRSCGLYFSHDRVPWQRPAGPAMQALPASIGQAVRQGSLGAGTRVSPHAWLQWLASWPASLREQAALDLLGYWLKGAGQRALGEVAGQLRVKTYTLEQPDGTRRAGASGWTAENLPVWFASSGTSANVVPERALLVLQATRSVPSPEPRDDALQGRVCVRVRYFARYPLAALVPIGATAPAAPGPLKGRYHARFQNGQTLDIESRGELHLAGTTPPPELFGELALDDYVARVIDREGSASPRQAAWALAIAARTHVLAHGRPGQGCLEIDDSSAAQRVAPRPPTAGARAAARATSGLLLAGGYAVAGQYHQNQGRDGVMSWAQARRQAEHGASYLDILQTAYPKASLASAGEHGALACEPLSLVHAWLERERPRWRRLLAAEPGFTDPGELQVCRLTGGRAHAHSGSHRIDVSGYQTLEERLAVAHEFVHLAFAHHPRGREELFVETQARKLLGVLP